MGGYFSDDHRTVVRNYYSEQFRVGRCPPGLAKKNNGCMPPGQARKWNIGQLNLIDQVNGKFQAR